MLFPFLFFLKRIPNENTHIQAKCGVREGAKTESSSGIVPTGGPRRGPPTLPRDRQPLPYPRRDPYLLPRCMCLDRVPFFF